MPYKATGRWVMVLRNGRWVRYKQHPSGRKAQAHARALNANVGHRRRKR